MSKTINTRKPKNRNSCKVIEKPISYATRACLQNNRAYCSLFSLKGNLILATLGYQ